VLSESLTGSLLSEPSLSVVIFLDKVRCLGNSFAHSNMFSLRLYTIRVLSDFSVSLLVKVLDALSLVGFETFGPLGELSLERSSIILLELIVVVLDMSTHDVISVYLSIVHVL